MSLEILRFVIDHVIRAKHQIQLESSAEILMKYFLYFAGSFAKIEEDYCHSKLPFSFKNVNDSLFALSQW
jgi:hypothetical protein